MYVSNATVASVGFEFSWHSSVAGNFVFASVQSSAFFA